MPHPAQVADGILRHTRFHPQLAGAVDGCGVSAGEAVPAGGFYRILGRQAGVNQPG